jgi:hypothetical protein
LEAVKRVLLDLASTNKLPTTVTGQSRDESDGTENLVPQEQQLASNVVAGIAEKILQSAWAQVDLAHEHEACDFLADRLCSDPGFVSKLEVLGLWLKETAKEAQRETRLLSQERHATGSPNISGKVEASDEEVVNMTAQEREGDLEHLRLNLRAALTTKLPRRSGGSMIHVAAADGGYVVLSGVIRILKLILPCDQWEQILNSRCRCPPPFSLFLPPHFHKLFPPPLSCLSEAITHRRSSTKF